METLFLWTGAVVWACAALRVLRLACELGLAFCVAVDWVRWAVAMKREHKLPMTWKYMPEALLRRWWHFACHDHRTCKWGGQYGYWQGFRKWGVYPAGKP